MADLGASEVPAVERYLGLVRRRWPMIALITVVVTALALALGASGDEEYASSADVYLTRFDVAGQLGAFVDPDSYQPAERVIETQRQLARLPAVATRAVERADVAGATSVSLLGSSSVTAQPNADLLTFSVRDKDSQVAVKLAGAYAAAFAEYRSDLDVEVIETIIDDVKREVDLLSQGDARTNAAQIRELTADLSQLRTVRALQTSNVTVVRPAVGAIKAQSRPLEAGLAGAALGLAFGTGLALLLEALDTRVRSDIEIARRLDVPLLGRLQSPGGFGRRQEKLVMGDRAESLEGEAYRLARTNIESVAGDHRSIMLSAVERETDDSATLVSNLALALARSSKRTILLDLDLRRAAVDRLFDVQDRPGLSEIVAGELQLDDALHTIWSGEGQSLELLPIGRRPGSVGDLLASPKLHGVLGELQEHASLVILHGPPLLGTADALALTPAIDGLIVIAGLGRVHQGTMSDLGEALEGAVETLGVIVTGGRRAVIGPRPGGPRGTRRPEAVPASGNGTPVRAPFTAEDAADLVARASTRSSARSRRPTRRPAARPPSVPADLEPTADGRRIAPPTLTWR
ncbi:MAG: hypothetical protein WKF43_00275 [Acidimicrobiales bacterium]